MLGPRRSTRSETAPTLAWLKRFGWVGLVASVVVFGSWLGWYWRLEVLLERRLEALAAGGVTVVPCARTKVPIDAELNAAVWWKQAGIEADRLRTRRSDAAAQWEFHAFLSDSIRSDDRAIAEIIARHYGGVLDPSARAAACERVDWGAGSRHWRDNARKLARVLNAAAQQAGAAELVTAEKPEKPMFRVTNPTVHSIRPAKSA